ncbi:MAG: c-type cytochrome [Planctomycetota bacterium]
MRLHLASVALVLVVGNVAWPGEMAVAPADVVIGPQSPGERGAKVTFERLAGPNAKSAAYSQRTRLLSLAVERGETPSPFVQPGMFRATYLATLSLPMRDRYRFRVDGRGSCKLTINGEKVLDGSLRPGKSLETAQPVRLNKGDNDINLVFESSAMGDGQFRLFWAGTDFAFEPIAPERLAWPAGDADLRAGEQLQYGLQLFAERRCARCHDPIERRIGESAFGELDESGPDLRTIAGRARRDWLAAWLRDPREFRPDATMPKFHFAGQKDADDVAAYLAGLGAPLTGPEFAPVAAAAGGKRFRQLGCVACHVPPERDRSEAKLGARIALDFVPQKWHAAALVLYLQDPQRDYTHSRMPNFALSLDDATTIAAYLLAAPATALPVSHGNADNGKRLVKHHGCAKCHALDVPHEEEIAGNLANIDAGRGCLASGAAAKKAPDHGFTDEQRAASRAFLPFAIEAPFRRAPLDFVARHIRAERCTACHALDSERSTWARTAEQASVPTPVPLDEDPVAMGLPALTWIGAKLQPSWIEKFVLGEQESPRPWLRARMPAFHAHGAAIVAGLVREHGYGAADEPPDPPDAQSAIFGERLINMGTGFGCVQCHAVGNKPAVQVFEREGIELLTSRRRLRHEYYARWLLDPTRIDPDSRMPPFAKGGKTAFTEVLGGDGAKQFEAIWNYLGSLLPAPR